MLCTTSSEMRSPSGRVSQLGEAICVAPATIPDRSTYRRRAAAAAFGRECEAIEREIGVGDAAACERPL
jgi:hypothetical protein